MAKQIDLKEVERKAYRSNFEDGLWDMFLGAMLFQSALGMVLYRQGWSELYILAAMLAFVVVVLIAFRLAKKYIIMPRMGLVQFGPARKARKRKLSLILSLSLLLGIVVFAIAIAAYANVANGSDFTNWSPAIYIPFAAFTIFSVVVFSLAAYLLDYPRLYLYGWFFGLAMPVNILLDEQFGISYPWATAVFSAIMVLIGLVLFIRFVQTHPVQELEV